MNTDCVLCEVGTEVLYLFEITVSLRVVNKLTVDLLLFLLFVITINIRLTY